MQASPLRGPGFPPLARRSVAGYGDCPAGTAPIPDAVGDGRTARRHPAVMPPADPSPEGGGFAAHVVCFFLITPIRLWGGNQEKGFGAVAASTRRFVLVPPPAPGGGTGRVKEKGIAGESQLPLVAGRLNT